MLARQLNRLKKWFFPSTREDWEIMKEYIAPVLIQLQEIINVDDWESVSNQRKVVKWTQQTDLIQQH